MDAVRDLHPADAADVLEALDLDERRLVLEIIEDPAAADILQEMGNAEAAEVAEGLDSAQLASILDEMEVEEAADVLGDLPESQAEGALFAMDDAAEAEIRSLLAYPDDTAGGRMTLDYLALPVSLSAGDTLEEYRRLAKGLRGAYYLYAVSDEGRLVGVVNLRELLLSDADATLGDIALPNPLFVHALDDQETAAQLIARYDLMALPVVDEEHHLVGVIQHEDLVDVLVEEATEDMYRLVGVGTEERTLTPIRSSLRRRLPWLVLNLGTQLLLVAVLLYFQGAIAHVAALAVLFPIVTGQGGNVGAQTMTLMVRSIALGEVDRSNTSRLVAKELITGCLLGLAMGGLAGVLALVIANDPDLARQLSVAVWAAMALNLAAGALAGALVPLGLTRVGVDPAVASSMMVTTVTDTLGVLLFMGIFLAIA